MFAARRGIDRTLRRGSIALRPVALTSPHFTKSIDAHLHNLRVGIRVIVIMSTRPSFLAPACQIRQARLAVLCCVAFMRGAHHDVISLNHRSFGQHLDLLTAMYRLRRRVFKDRLDWSASISGDIELDVYDTLNPTYLLA